jgi:hypothetical protein
MTGWLLVGLLTQTQAPECQTFQKQSGEWMQRCSSASGEYELPAPPPPASAKPADGVDPDALPDPEAAVDEHLEKEEPGGRYGVVSELGVGLDLGVSTATPDPLRPPRTRADVVGASVTTGVGFRYGFKERVADRGVWMPAFAVLGGTSFNLESLSPFLETRLEYLYVTPGGPLQPNFEVYATSGVNTTPIGRAAPLSLQPHVGLGLGWNWRPRGGGGGGGGWGGGWGNLGGLGGGGGAAAALAIPVALAIVGMVFAGRVEVRYTARPLSGPGNDFVSVMFGLGT